MVTRMRQTRVCPSRITQAPEGTPFSIFKNLDGPGEYYKDEEVAKNLDDHNDASNNIVCNKLFLLHCSTDFLVVNGFAIIKLPLTFP